MSNAIIIGTRGNDTLRAIDGETAWVFADPFTAGSLLPGANGVLSQGHGGNDLILGSDRAGAMRDPIYFGDAWRMTGTARGGNDRFEGDGASEAILGDAEEMFGHSAGGDDLLRGGGEFDILIGDGEGMLDRTQGGNDSLFGGADFDELFGDGGILLDDAKGGNDLLDGGDHRDFLFGDGDLTNSASGGNDSLFGRQGNDLLEGDGVLDERAWGGNDRLWGGDGNDQISGDGHLGPFEGPISLPGARVVAGHDILWGGGGADRLFGDGEGARRLATCGDDRLNGGVGNDELWGDVANPDASIRHGQDSFIFNRGSDRDVIGDFDDRAGGPQDLIVLAGYTGLHNFAQLRGFISNGSDGAVIDLGAAAGRGVGLDTITLLGITADQLDASDFRF
jgi:Ca2+-binding RTX toxin-like protein